MRVLARQKDHPSVGIVLKPLARGIVRLWLQGQTVAGVWEASKAGRDAEWHFLERDQFEALSKPVPAAA